jgi:probable rRNA maturation factor
MSAGIEIIAPCKDWRTALPKARDICRRAARAALADQAAADRGEVAIVLADDATLRDLNARFRKIDKPTNVLSFPAASEGEADAPLGDIVLAFETVAREAEEDAKSLADHTAHLVVHGTLHLLGHDHQSESEAVMMEDAERRILAGMGIADPYADRPLSLSGTAA